MRRAAELGVGLAALPDYIVGENSSLLQVDIGEETPTFDTYFVYAEELRNSKRIQVFRDFLVAQAKSWKF